MRFPFVEKAISSEVDSLRFSHSPPLTQAHQDLPPEVRSTSISSTVSNSVSSTTALVEAATGNTEGARRYHEESLEGKRGIFSQTASAAGEAIQAISSGDVSEYVERAERGDFGVVPQVMNNAGEFAHNMIFGEADKAPEERTGIVPFFKGLFGGKK